MKHEPRTEWQDERELIARARAGDIAAFEELYRTHVGRIYAVCLRMSANMQWAEECTQSAFVRGWQALASFQGKSAFSTWLHRIAVNEVLGRRRREARRGTHLEMVAEYEPKTVGEESHPRQESRMDLEYAIGKLPAGARDVFVLHAIHGYSHEETAGMLDIAVGTSKAQLHRAKKLLRSRLDQ